MAEYFLSLPGDLTASFKTASAIGETERLQLGAYVPGLTFLDERPENVDIAFTHAVSDTPRLEDNGSAITLYAPESEALPDDVYHLLYGVTRRALLERGHFTVHGACVGQGDDYTLIVGHSGSGKTTITHKLIEEHGLKLFSGNKTVIRFDEDGSIKALAGTRTMTALDQDLKRHAYEMATDQYTEQSQVPITSVAIVRINDGVEEAQTLDSISALHTLYPYFMDAVNSDVIVNGKDVFDGSPDKSAKEKLSQQLKQAAEHVPVRKYAGTVPFLTGKVLQP